MPDARTRRRRTTRQPALVLPRTLSSSGLSPNTGPLASAAWLAARALFPTDPHWFVEIVLPAENGRLYRAGDHAPATHFAIEIHATEWGFSFHHDHKTSWIRVTDVPFVHGHDDHDLCAQTPPLKDIGRLLRTLERRHGIELDRAAPWIRTSIVGGEPVIRDWLLTL